MADSTISGLPSGTTLSGTELVPIVQAGVTVQVPVSFIALLASSIGVPNFSDFEIPTGAINGANRTYTIAHTPKTTTAITGYIRQGGVGAFLPMVPGIDFTIVAATITTTNAPSASSNLYFSYRY